MTWVLAIDYGTTNTSAAMKDHHSTAAIDLGGQRQLPSCVLIGDDGTIRTGVEADRLSERFIERFVSTPKRRMAEGSVVVAGADVPVVDMVAATLRAVYQEAVRFKGVAPAKVVLTHPARWSPAQIAVLYGAAVGAGIGDPVMLSEPVAAAKAFLRHYAVREGAPFAVFDLGGGTLDIAIVRKVDGELVQIAAPGGIDPLGGEDFDAVFMQHILEMSLDDTSTDASEEPRSGVRRRALQRSVRDAKESLSTHESTWVVVPGVDHQIVVTRAELEEAIRSDVVRATSELIRCLDRAKVPADSLDAVFLAGGSSRIPLVAHEIRSRLPGVRVETVGEPKVVTAEGAAWMTELPTPEPLPPPPPPPPSHRRRRSTGARIGLSAAALAVSSAIAVGFATLDKQSPSTTTVTFPQPAATDAPVEATDPPVEATDPPVEATDPPVEPTDPPVEPTDPPVTETDPLFDRFPVMYDGDCSDGEVLPGLESRTVECTLYDGEITFVGNVVEAGYDSSSYLEELSGHGSAYYLDEGTWNIDGIDQGQYFDFDWQYPDGSWTTCRAWGDYGSDLVAWACASDLDTAIGFWMEAG